MNGITCAAGKKIPSRMRKNPWKRIKGLTLTELVCVMAIIAILASLYLGAIARAFVKVKKLLGS